MPTRHNLLKHDASFFSDETTVLIGLDEVGRGALAGPVMTGAVWIDKAFLSRYKNDLEVLQIQDSKKLSEKERNAAFSTLQKWAEEGHLHFTITKGSVEEIDHTNILKATQLAFERALAQTQLALKLTNASTFFKEVTTTKPNVRVLIDGNPLKHFKYVHTNIIRGDQKSFCIAAASIVAKVTRDQLMRDLHTRYPVYNFDQNKGYGTQQHRDAIAHYGLCPLHRKTFCHTSTDTQMDLNLSQA